MLSTIFNLFIFKLVFFILLSNIIIMWIFVSLMIAKKSRNKFWLLLISQLLYTSLGIIPNLQMFSRNFKFYLCPWPCPWPCLRHGDSIELVHVLLVSVVIQLVLLVVLLLVLLVVLLLVLLVLLLRYWCYWCYYYR